MSLRNKTTTSELKLPVVPRELTIQYLTWAIEIDDHFTAMVHVSCLSNNAFLLCTNIKRFGRRFTRDQISELHSVIDCFRYVKGETTKHRI